MTTEWTPPKPDLQRVIFVADAGDGVEGRREALQVAFHPWDHLDAKTLVDEARRVIVGTPNTFEEWQRQTHWGATGMYVQEILIAYFAGVGSGLTVEAIRGAMRRLITPSTEAQMPIPFKGDSNEGAWRAFAQCLSSAFSCSLPSMVSGERKEDSWSFLAESDRSRFEGTVSFDGRWIHVARVPGAERR